MKVATRKLKLYYEQGKTLPEISELLRCPLDQLMNVLEQWRNGEREVGRPWKDLPEERMFSEYQAGTPTKQIARLIGISPQTVLNRLRAAGILVRPPGRVPRARP